MGKKEYKPLTIPRLSWDKKTLSRSFGELVAQPLEPGLGITLGSAIRRVLLGEVEGVAVTSVIIKGVNNEFAALEGIAEDAMQVVLNIKQIVVSSKDGKGGKMKLHFNGEGVAHVSDIEADENLELVNLDHVIAHVAPDGELDIEFFVEPGRGYETAKWPTDSGLQEDGRVYLDAMFSPVKQVAFDIEKTRVGKEIDYDKLMIKVHTDGSETPSDVMHYAVSVLRTQLEHFLIEAEVPFNEISTVEPVVEEEPEVEVVEPVDVSADGVPIKLLLRPIEELELSVRAHNCLVNAGVRRVIDLVNTQEEDALKIKNFGRKSLNEVKDSIKAFGLSFGMNIKEDDLKRGM